VHPGDPVASANALAAAVDQAVSTPQGQARLALIASFGNIAGWWDAHQPRPTAPDDVIRAQAQWIKNAFILGLGPIARADLERRAGGNPSWNTGVDYRRQLARSSQTEQVLAAYRVAGLAVNADLASLDAAPRIAADPAAVRYVRQYGVPTGDIEAPVLTLHTTGDGGAVPDLDRWYGDRVRHEGNASKLRQLYVDRGYALRGQLRRGDRRAAYPVRPDRLRPVAGHHRAPAHRGGERPRRGVLQGAGLRQLRGRADAAGVHHLHPPQFLRSTR
jgi:hypothetical protein